MLQKSEVKQPKLHKALLISLGSMMLILCQQPDRMQRVLSAWMVLETMMLLLATVLIMITAPLTT
jgi:hypothetical protein